MSFRLSKGPQPPVKEPEVWPWEKIGYPLLVDDLQGKASLTWGTRQRCLPWSVLASIGGVVPTSLQTYDWADVDLGKQSHLLFASLQTESAQTGQ